MINAKELKAHLIRCDMTIEGLAKYLDKSREAVSRKINGHNEFTRKEITMISEVLNLTPEERDTIFFENAVAEKGT